MYILAKLKTNEIFLKEVFEKVKDEYTFLEEYKNTRTPILCIHNKCNYKFKIKPYSFLIKGTRCPNCNKYKVVKKSDFLIRLYNRYGNQFTILSEYKNTVTPIIIKCNKCNHIWSAYPNNLLVGHSCPKCYGNKKKSNEEFEEMIFSLVGNKFNFIESYKGNKVKILCQCNRCDNIFKVAPISFKHHPYCPICDLKNNRKITTYIINKRMVSQYDSQFKFSGRYNGKKSLLNCHCNKCGNDFKITYSNFLRRKNKCLFCKNIKETGDA